MPRKLFNQNKEDLVHDINSAVMAVTQALKMINNRKISSRETTKVMPLLCEKMDELGENWRKLKKNLL